MSTPAAHRFHIIDPTTREMIETSRSVSGSFMIASRYSRRRGYPIEVFDSMAHMGWPELWRVEEKQTATGTHGSIVVVSRREERAA